jgi:hypothetical protein
MIDAWGVPRHDDSGRCIGSLASTPTCGESSPGLVGSHLGRLGASWWLVVGPEHPGTRLLPADRRRGPQANPW